jgi:DNA topoisomerase I
VSATSSTVVAFSFGCQLYRRGAASLTVAAARDAQSGRLGRPGPGNPAAMTVVHEAIADDEVLAIAETAGLRYVTDALPGIRRVRCGKGFSYRRANGTIENRRRTLDRIRSLAIPPAWTDVWICPYANGHLQATGRDARDRKQYRYHPQWREVRDAAKYDRVVDVGRALPRIRERVKEDLARPGMPREKVLAAVVQLLDDTLMRVGNAEYARLNESFGATTIRNEHVSVRGGTVLFTFRGKSGRHHELRVVDRQLARIVGRCQALPGQELFAYIDDDGTTCDVGSQDVNEYLREIAMDDRLSAKDLRTLGGTVLAAQALAEADPPASTTEAKTAIADAVRRVAADLGNTAAVARSAYIHPAVIDAFTAGTLPRDAILASASQHDVEDVMLDFLEETV